MTLNLLSFFYCIITAGFTVNTIYWLIVMLMQLMPIQVNQQGGALMCRHIFNPNLKKKNIFLAQELIFFLVK